MAPSLNVAEVQLFRNMRTIAEFGDPTSAVFQEVNDFYRLAGATLNAKKIRMLPTSVEDQILEGGDSQDTILFAPEGMWIDVRGRFSRTVDQARVVHAVRSCLGNDSNSDSLLVVTDQELTPPPKWNYIIWDSFRTPDKMPGDGAVSLAPLNPRYWADLVPRSGRQTDTVSITKQRMRVACLSIVGQWLGLRRCDCDECFMYSEVDSFERLDDMVHLGNEHLAEAPWLNQIFDATFPSRSERPERVEALIFSGKTTGSTYA